MENLSNLVMTYLVFMIAAASPGPATLAIMATSATMGRKAGALFALGVVNGSIIWGILAAFGLVSLLSHFAWAFGALKIIGGAYLLWMAVKAIRIAATPNAKAATAKTRGKYLYVQGMALHLTNPKALLSWSAIIAFGVPKEATTGYLVALLIGCAVLASLLFIGYALLFSTPRMMAGYQRLRRKINAALAAVFGLAGVKLLSSSI